MNDPEFQMFKAVIIINIITACEIVMVKLLNSEGYITKQAS